jgi:hypothetical protein
MQTNENHETSAIEPESATKAASIASASNVADRSMNFEVTDIDISKLTGRRPNVCFLVETYCAERQRWKLHLMTCDWLKNQTFGCKLRLKLH